MRVPELCMCRRGLQIVRTSLFLLVLTLILELFCKVNGIELRYLQSNVLCFGFFACLRFSLNSNA